ncbi:conjugal transfer protein TraN [Sphingobium sp. B11D3A]|uniref:conjugal transfer protein TraN n=1 Tax=Sphingobium sp. B11D3A TaxID=2940574 RepID=UPI002224371C|nr:conjugal transfer protein TraN [Sphingobium sp. B11D3A]MCW2393563.1 conjugal transfer mating pair stabilization protein TraN [Sphingobium sp. B11D3A]
MLIAGAQAQTGSMQAAQNDGSQFAKDLAPSAAEIPGREVTADTMPGYQGTPSDLSGLMGGSDDKLMNASGSAASNEAYGLMRSADDNRAQIDPSEIESIAARGRQINDDAAAIAGIETHNSQGQCEPVSQQGSPATYEATCDVGEAISTSEPTTQYSCPEGWSLSGTTCSITQTQPAKTTYSCQPGETLSGTSCTSSQAPTLTGYSCPSGFALSGTSCTKTLSQAASISGYSCPADYALQGTTCKRTLQQSATPIYACPADYQLTGTSCNASRTYQATPTYSCPGGFFLSGATCQQTVTRPADVTLVCPSGQVLNNGSCIMQSTYAATATTTCPPGWDLQSGQCAKGYNYTANAVYTCPANYFLDGTLCRSNRYQCGVSISSIRYTVYNGQEVCATRKAEVSGGCSNATFFGEAKLWGQAYCLSRPQTVYQCAKSWTDAQNPLCPSLYHATATAAVNYSCPSGGSPSGAICYGTNYVGTEIQYSCPSGGNLAGSSCTVSQVSTPTTNYSCSAGQTLSGTSCSATTSQSASVTYACPSGGTLTGTSCAASDTKPAELTYRCPTDWQLSGTQCTSILSQTAEPSYTCPVGYDLNGSMCSRLQSQPATAQYTCPAGYQRSDETCYRKTSATAAQTCPDGYALSQTTCTRTQTQDVNMTSVCSTPEATLQDGQCVTSEKKTDCTQLASNAQCTFLRETCLDVSPGSTCRVAEKTYRCPVPDSAQTETSYICSGDMWCMNGSCQTVEREASDEFKDALVAMGAIDQVGEDFDPDNMQLFEGTAESCHKPIFGAINCCAGKSSGLLTGAAGIAAKLALGTGPGAIAAVATQFLTMFACSNEEKSLDVKDRMGLCHSVGSFCTESVLGVCTTKRSSFCCYQSKLTRIIQEQGRPQIGKDWGKPEAPMCGGFSPDEFAKLDLSQMDFSEIYADMLEAVQLPDQAQQASDIQNKIRDYYEQTSSGGTH